MRDQKAIANFERTDIGFDRSVFYFGNTTIVADVRHDNEGGIHLRPVRGDQVACGQWNDLDECEVAGYCELLEDELRRREANEKSE